MRAFVVLVFVWLSCDVATLSYDVHAIVLRGCVWLPRQVVACANDVRAIVVRFACGAHVVCHVRSSFACFGMVLMRCDGIASYDGRAIGVLVCVRFAGDGVSLLYDLCAMFVRCVCEVRLLCCFVCI